MARNNMEENVMKTKNYMKQFIDTYYDRHQNLDKQPVIELINDQTFNELSDTVILEEGRSLPELLSIIEEKVYANRLILEHPRNFAFIPAPVEDVSRLGDMINTFYNPNACGWYASSGTACIEHALINWLCEQAGYTKNASGIIVSGGSMANLTAAITARDTKIQPDQIAKGVVYISNQAHHSINKSLHIIGIPDDRIRYINTDDNLKIIPDDLDKKIINDKRDGLIPFLVIATAGSTNAGVIDPLHEIALIADKHDLWFHIDGAFGASLLLSGEHKHLVNRINSADSITWDAHKWLFQTYSCAMLLVKNRSTLLHSFSDNAEYLADAQKADHTDFWDLGIELSHPARGMKLWLTLQNLGTKQIAQKIDFGVYTAEYTQQVICNFNHWQIVTPAQTAIINFRYYHKDLSAEILNDINSLLSEKIVASGYAQIMTTKINGATTLRMCTTSPKTTHQDIDQTISKLNDFLNEVL